MGRKQKVSQKKSARTMRSAVAYDRLAAKAWRAGQPRQAELYHDQSARLKRKAELLAERGQ